MQPRDPINCQMKKIKNTNDDLITHLSFTQKMKQGWLRMKLEWKSLFGVFGLHFFEKKFIFKRLKFLKHVLLLVFYSQEINILKIRF